MRGIDGMIEEERYCIAVLHPLSAVKAALRRPLASTGGHAPWPDRVPDFDRPSR